MSENNEKQAENLADVVSNAMRRAWYLGQTYWQQADSEYASQNKKSEETLATYRALVDETRAALAQQPQGEAVYQVYFGVAGWRDVERSDYEKAPKNDRRALFYAAPAPAASPIDVTKIPGYVSPAQVSETAAAHAKGGKPVDPCDCSACVRMRGGLYGDTPSASPEIESAYQRDFDKACRAVKFNVETFPELANMSPTGAIDWLVVELAARHEKFDVPSASPAALTDEQIRAIARNYGRFVFPGVYAITEFDCEEDFFNCVRALLAASPADQGEDARDAARYRWMRNPQIDVALVIDERTDWIKPDETCPGTGGYWVYKYRSGEELDAAIDAAMSATPPAAGD